MTPSNILVTGAGRGIGREISHVLSRSNYRLILIDKYFPDDFEAFVQKLEKHNTPHVILQVDITKQDERHWLLTELESTFGGLHGIVHNAGIHKHSSFKSLTQEDFDLTMDVNLKGAVFLTQELIPLLHEQSSIVFISSMRAYVGSDHGLDYVVSKAGMIGAMRAMAVEFAPTVRVNAIAPFSIDTPMIKDDTKTMRKERIDQTLLKRLGTPLDVANAVEFLLSEKSAFITGQVLHINGGAYFG